MKIGHLSERLPWSMNVDASPVPSDRCQGLDACDRDFTDVVEGAAASARAADPISSDEVGLVSACDDSPDEYSFLT
ncbi:MAG: hypothetical protein ACYC1D_01535 [Acidimicrobiales bacterium]